MKYKNEIVNIGLLIPECGKIVIHKCNLLDQFFENLGPNSLSLYLVCVILISTHLLLICITGSSSDFSPHFSHITILYSIVFFPTVSKFLVIRNIDYDYKFTFLCVKIKINISACYSKNCSQWSSG